MSQYAAELCYLLITDHFGELYSIIFSYLLHNGRQPLPRIVQKTHLSPRQVKHGLAVLIQQHLVFHCTSLDDGITYYESDWRTAYYLVRAAKIVQFVEERLGSHAALVISTLLALGHAKISHLESLPGLLLPGKQKDFANGTYNDNEGASDDGGGAADIQQPNGHHETKNASRLHVVLQRLVAFGLLIRVRRQHFQSPDDNYDAALKIAQSSDTQGLKGKKLEAMRAAHAEELVKEWTDGIISQTLPSATLLRSTKRHIRKGDSPSPRKKRKLDTALKEESDEDDHILNDDDDGDGDSDGDDEMVDIDGDMVVRVNYEKFNVLFRNRRLVELADRTVTPVTSLVYETLLSRVELQTPKCRDRTEPIPEGEEAEQYSTAIDTNTISSDLDPDLDLIETIAGISANTSNGSQGQDDESDHDDENEEDEDGEDISMTNKRRGPNRKYLVDQHLSALAAEPNFFCTRRIHQGGEITWAIEYRHLAKKLRHLELERIIEARFGSFAVRIVRVLAAKGKLDEKRLQELSLMASKDLRQILGQMAGAGFIELQEVPRDAQRQPSRTIYLWFYDPDRVRTMVIEDTYKSMSRCFQRIRFEREKLKFLLEKAARTDVKGKEERYLSAAELKSLEKWKETEALLLGEVMKLDDLIAVLRDY